MWQLLEQIRELEQHGSKQLNGRLLLVRCRLLKGGAPTPADRRHQSLVIEVLIRVLRRQLGPRELTFQVSETDVLVVLTGHAALVAVPLIQQSIAEIRSRLLGDDETPREAITVDALSIGENGEVRTTEIVSADGRFDPSVLGDGQPVAKPVDISKVLKPGELRYSFTPVWDVKRKAITTYYLRCHGNKAGFGEESGYAVLHGGSKSSFVPDLDLKMLVRAEAELSQYKDGKMPFVLVWPLHARTIEHAEKFQHYAAVMAKLAEYIQGRMVVAVHGIHADWPVSRMQWVVGAARRYCRAVTVNLPLETGILPQMAQCGVTNVSFNLAEQVDEPSLVPRLLKVRETAVKQGLTAVAHRIPTRGIAIAAVSAGFAYVHADFLGTSEKPEAAFRYEFIDLVNASADLGMSAAATQPHDHLASSRSTMSHSWPGAAT